MTIEEPSSEARLKVKLPPIKGPGFDTVTITDLMKEMFLRGEFTDVTLVCAEQSFKAHRIVLAAESEVFKEGLAAASAQAAREGQAAPCPEVRLTDVHNPEAVKFMLDFMYNINTTDWEDYNPRTQEINKDILRLANQFKLPRLTERAMHWLSKDLTTGNVVERLSICEDFGLTKLREKILGQLTFNRRALADIAGSPQIIKYPELMQAILVQAAAVTEPQPKKRGRKA